MKNNYNLHVANNLEIDDFPLNFFIRLCQLYYLIYIPEEEMEEYILDKAKHKAIAVYTFNSINCDGKTSIKISKLREALKQVLLTFNANIDMEEVDKIINSEDKFQKRHL